MVSHVSVSLDKDRAMVRLRVGFHDEWTLSHRAALRLAARFAIPEESPGQEVCGSPIDDLPALSLVDTLEGKRVRVDCKAHRYLLTVGEAQIVARELKVIGGRAQRVEAGLPALKDDELADPE